MCCRTVVGWGLAADADAAAAFTRQEQGLESYAPRVLAKVGRHRLDCRTRGSVCVHTSYVSDAWHGTTISRSGHWTRGCESARRVFRSLAMVARYRGRSNRTEGLLSTSYTSRTLAMVEQLDSTVAGFELCLVTVRAADARHGCTIQAQDRGTPDLVSASDAVLGARPGCTIRGYDAGLGCCLRASEMHLAISARYRRRASGVEVCLHEPRVVGVCSCRTIQGLNNMSRGLCSRATHSICLQR